MSDLAAFLAARLDDDLAWVRERWGDDPGRDRWDVEAKRAILELHDQSHECSAYDHTGAIDNCTWCPEGDCTTLRLLAAVYRDHPDYRQEWQP